VHFFIDLPQGAEVSRVGGHASDAVPMPREQNPAWLSHARCAQNNKTGPNKKKNCNYSGIVSFPSKKSLKRASN
jgi:hypothetical protein